MGQAVEASAQTAERARATRAAADQAIVGVRERLAGMRSSIDDIDQAIRAQERASEAVAASVVCRKWRRDESGKKTDMAASLTANQCGF